MSTGGIGRKSWSSVSAMRGVNPMLRGCGWRPLNQILKARLRPCWWSTSADYLLASPPGQTFVSGAGRPEVANFAVKSQFRRALAATAKAAVRPDRRRPSDNPRSSMSSETLGPLAIRFGRGSRAVRR